MKVIATNRTAFQQYVDTNGKNEPGGIVVLMPRQRTTIDIANKKILSKLKEQFEGKITFREQGV